MDTKPAERRQLAIVRAITTIDEDGDAAWRVLAVSDETHTFRRLQAEWTELIAPPIAAGEGVGVASPLLFVATGPRRWVRQQALRLHTEADELLTRLRLDQTDVAEELAWLGRPLRGRRPRFAGEVWRALALRELLAGDELAAPGTVEGTIGNDYLFAFYAVLAEADAEELAGLVERALEAWLALVDA